ncbi:hypothetical protein DSCA_16480 [Desulfosarcina alkanivorans]|uniref:Uncharacterized protein n=1 Tax=Desulfosarcina alkanivorans TaxID=571177 RepID=A0A5K7YF79_9BACT|nr:hypothetical protein DSCA_16480 [Desulfosarcina alkanivorans]
MEVYHGFNELLSIISNLMDVIFATNRQYSDKETKKWLNEKFGKFAVGFVSNTN